MSLETFGAELAAVTKAYVTKALAAVIERLEAVEARIATVKDGADGLAGPAGERGADGPRGPEGPAGLPGRDGLPGVQGPAGKDGTNGADGHDGINGKDGADGLRVEDIDFDFNPDTRMLSLRFARDGVVVKEQAKKVRGWPVRKGVWTAGTAYEYGDIVTYSGSEWCALEDTTAKPDEHTADGRRAWRLSVKRGGEGKKGEPGAAGRDGKDGRPGRDHTQLDPATGRTW